MAKLLVMPRSPHFRSGIGHASGLAAHAESAADIDDLARSPRHHAGQDGAHHVEGAAHVEHDDRVEFLRRCLNPGLADRPRTAGHVDQDIDGAERLRRNR